MLCSICKSILKAPFTNHLHHLQFTTFQQTIEMHSMHARNLEVKNNGNEERERETAEKYKIASIRLKNFEII